MNMVQYRDGAVEMVQNQSPVTYLKHLSAVFDWLPVDWSVPTEITAFRR